MVRAAEKEDMRRNGHEPEAEIASDPVVSAKAASLWYVCDAMPGIRRLRKAPPFRYVDSAGRPVADEESLARIRSLVIPPAWTDVWICPRPDGHLQATGRDKKGRKQYRYHPRWREVRDATKFDRLAAFGRALPELRQRVEQDLSLSGLPREKVLATVVRLLEQTLIRVGNEEYARANGSVGLTTMRDGHADIDGSTIRFCFRGKSGKEHEVGIRDRRLAGVVQRCRDVPGDELFQYVDDDGEHRPIGSGDVNGYIRSIAGDDFSAKDFRTWWGTVIAAEMLSAMEPAASQAAAKRNLVQAVKDVAERLGNTPAIARKAYIHPAVIDAYMEGWLSQAMARAMQRDADVPSPLRPEEAAVLALLDGPTASTATNGRGNRANSRS